MRLTTQVNGDHHITIPVHKELRVGLLNGILSDVADHLGLTLEELVENLFGK